MKQRNSKLAAMMLCMGFTVSVPTFTYGMGENALNILQQSQKFQDWLLTLMASLL